MLTQTACTKHTSPGHEPTAWTRRTSHDVPEGGSGAQVGVRKARQLAAEHALRLVPVHHMEAHALVRSLFP